MRSTDIVRHTFILMLEDGIHGIKERHKQEVVGFVGQQERRLRHRHEHIQEHGACGALQVLHVRPNVVDDSEQGRMKRLEATVGARQ